MARMLVWADMQEGMPAATIREIIRRIPCRTGMVADCRATDEDAIRAGLACAGFAEFTS